MTIHWIIVLTGRTRLCSFHHWKSEPTTPLTIDSFDRASRPLLSLRIEAESNRSCEE